MKSIEPKQTLSITIPITLYQRLQQEVGKGKISKFIKETVEEKLTEQESKLAQEYRECYANNPHLLEEAKSWERAGIETWLNYERNKSKSIATKSNKKNGRGIDIKPTTSAEKPEIIKVKDNYQLPKIIVNAADAEPEISKIINQIPDWRDDKINTRGDSYRTITKKYIDEQGNFQEAVSEKTGDTDKITARAIFYREIIRKLPQVRGTVLLDDSKFDALIGFKSNAYGQIIETVDKVIKSYLDNCQLEASETELYTVPDCLLYNPAKSVIFNNSIHEKYSQLNELEKKFARELDRFEFKWCRNPSRTGYSIPLITLGSTRNFYPDFLVFYQNKVIAIDTSGEHLIKDKVDRKLLNINSKLLARFISQGKWDEKTIEKIDENGWSLWKRRENDGGLSVIYRENLPEIIEQVLNLKRNE